MKTWFVKISIFAGELNKAITDAEERLSELKVYEQNPQMEHRETGLGGGRRSQESRGGREA